MMPQDQTKKEALFNEVKGSLFEYLMCRRLSELSGEELDFINSLDKNYSHVLSQQDQMVRQFYPEMLPFLHQVAKKSSDQLIEYIGEIPKRPRLRGKFINSANAYEHFEADVLLDSSQGQIPLSLKLNKKNSFVNTKSGGIKSFFTTYFPFVDKHIQQQYNSLVDREFTKMSYDLHALNDFEYPGDFSYWIAAGKSELPGELSSEERLILKRFYAVLAAEMHRILSHAQENLPREFAQSLPALLGFSSQDILQLICFHDFKSKGEESVLIHSFNDISPFLGDANILPFHQTSSVELTLGDIQLQIRIKPMNKFTTTAIKINCSVRFTPSYDA